MEYKFMFMPILKTRGVEKNSFYIMPKEIFNEEYSGLSNNAKLIYMMLLDRVNLSIKNNKANEQGEVYVIFTRDELVKKLNISKRNISYCFRQLENHRLIRIDNNKSFSVPLIYVGGLQNLQGGLQNLQGGLQNLQPSNTNKEILKKETEEKRSCYSQSENTKNGICNSKKTLSQYMAEQPNNYELALAKINCVRNNKIFTDKKGNEKKLLWQDITDRDFAYYYLSKHKEILGKSLPGGIRNGQGVTAFKNGIRLHYKISKENLCKYIDKMLLVYRDHPKNNGILSWGAITGYPALMDYLYKKADTIIKMEEKEYENIDAWWLEES